MAGNESEHWNPDRSQNLCGVVLFDKKQVTKLLESSSLFRRRGLEVLADVRHNLRFSHLIGRFHHDDVSAGALFCESLFQFALGLAGTKDQNRSSITKISNDLVEVA